MNYERQQDLLVARTQLIDEKRGRRWNTSAEGRQKTVDLVENAVADERESMLVRLLAAKVHVAIEAQNQADQRMEMNSVAGDDREPQVILVLPSNGSEIGVDDSGVESSDNEGDDQNVDEDSNDADVGQ